MAIDKSMIQKITDLLILVAGDVFKDVLEL